MKLSTGSVEWVRERTVRPIRKDSLRQVWQRATALARVFLFVSSWKGRITSRGSLLGQFTAVLSQAIYLHHLNTHIKL